MSELLSIPSNAKTLGRSGEKEQPWSFTMVVTLYGSASRAHTLLQGASS